MFNTVTFKVEINDLIRRGRLREAEERLLQAYSKLKAANSDRELDAVTSQLAHFYAMPEAEDLNKAEFYFLERETLSPGAYAKSQTAMFYFYVIGDFAKTTRKVKEIKPSEAATDRGSYYSALALKGHALIKLEMPGDAKEAIEDLLGLIKADPSHLPYGDEMNLLEAAISNPILAPRCREILDLIIPKIRSKEYVERAKALRETA